VFTADARAAAHDHTDAEATFIHHRTRIVVAEDDQVVREALVELVETEPSLELVGVAAAADEAIRLAAGEHPAVALVDVRMPGGGINAIRQICLRAPLTRVVVLSAYQDVEDVLRILAAGAAGYVVKGSSDTEIIEALHRAARGQLSMPASLAAECFRQVQVSAAEHETLDVTTRQREEALNTALEVTPDVLLLADDRGAIRLALGATEPIFGYRSNELTGQPLALLFLSAAPNQRSNGKGSPSRHRLVGRRRDGTDLPVDVSFRRVKVSSEQMLLVRVQDAAERIDAERAQLVHAALLDLSDDAIIERSLDNIILSWNAAAERLFGYSAAEAIGRHMSLIIPPEHGDELARINRNMAIGEPLDRLDTVRRHKDGHLIHVLLSTRPVRDAGGRVLESAPDTMIIVDPNGVMQMVNNQAEELFGYSRDELIGRELEMLLPERARAAHVAHRADFMRQPQRRRMGVGVELAGRRKDGHEFPIDVTTGPIETPHGLMVVAAVRDITHRRQVEEDLRRSLDRLNITARAREELLASLVHAQEHERRRIANDIHDDSIQAITAATLRLQQLRRHLTDESQINALTRLHEVLELAINRLRHLMFELRPPALDRWGLAAALRAHLDQVRSETGIEFRVDDRLRGEPPSERRLILYRIAQEALANARKHAQPHMILVELDHGDQGYLVRITDDGVGFNPSEVAERAGHYGLPSMMERARMADGSVLVDSSEGAGTRVEIWIPAEMETEGSLMPGVPGGTERVMPETA
jgi:PAS domain S-box-containing protein